MKNKVFLLLLAALTGLYFVVTGIQYWTPDYLQNILHAEPEVVAIYFSTTSLTGPVLGVIIGGIITTHYGGYNTRKAQKLQCIVGILAALSGIPIPFLNSFYQVGFLFWLLLFMGGFILPQVTGMMIDSVGEY